MNPGLEKQYSVDREPALHMALTQIELAPAPFIGSPKVPPELGQEL